MKQILITIAAVVLAEAGFADAIHDAAYNGNIAVVRAELNKNVDVNAKDADGNTPLDMAIWGEYTEIAELLITNGADVNLIDEEGYTPLDKALTGNYDEMAAVLHAHGAVSTENSSVDNRYNRTGMGGIVFIIFIVVICIMAFITSGGGFG
ncbi:ankyrin repeat domain-containing protein, partial [bacterium]|nr:ankyrin repeat domain-containing protein [bacterium]